MVAGYTISVFTSLHSSDWRWIEPETQHQVRWLFHYAKPQSLLERLITRPNLSRITGVFRCVKQAMRERADLVVVQCQRDAFWAAIAMRLLGAKMPLIAYAFHFDGLPTGLRFRVMKWAYSRVQRFAVYSEFERHQYSHYFGIPLERFEFVRWAIRASEPDMENEPPKFSGTYICAVGKDGRDYPTLVKAIAQMPDLNFVTVSYPYNLAGVTIPANLTALYQIPMTDAMNIVKHCQFMVMPLEAEDTACGLMTLFWAMLCRKACISTRSVSVEEYLPANYETPRVEAGDVQGWVEAIRTMSQDEALRHRCGEVGEKFVTEECSYDVALKGCLEMFRKEGVDVRYEPVLPQIKSAVM
ncbi:glycosyltransferase [Myxacorys almedinensis]|uniref:Glycosyltransferase n=1 Tax=Myxacorys almedinensis A TaxID=2690445 RepID=A0A8J7ZAX3_9CYAN|nr:glycosyltransferase [Myxacorys almedinensis]NDJ19588.1 glycosyltransferase [Myxacorys almedinensis A]